MSPLIDDPAFASPAWTIAGASFNRDPAKQIEHFARARFPTLPIEEAVKRYGVVEGNIVYADDYGRLVREIPSVDSGFNKLSRAEKWAASQVGPGVQTGGDLLAALVRAPGDILDMTRRAARATGNAARVATGKAPAPLGAPANRDALEDSIAARISLSRLLPRTPPASAPIPAPPAEPPTSPIGGAAPPAPSSPGMFSDLPNFRELWRLSGLPEPGPTYLPGGGVSIMSRRVSPHQF